MASEELLLNYLPILVFIIIAAGMSALMIGLSFAVGKQKPDADKNAAYECGFDAFDDARSRFDVRFFLGVLTVGFIYEWNKGALEWE
jgi:NADH-quinone oxidoreductase subunit A